MIVGFTITNYNGRQDAAIEYIRKVCILESPDIAENIVAAGTGVSVYSKCIDAEELSKQPFESKVIDVPNGLFIVASAVNFNLELLYNGSILRLSPTEYVLINPDEIPQFSFYMKKGLVRLFPEQESTKWLLRDGIWDDSGIWVDSEYWRD